MFFPKFFSYYYVFHGESCHVKKFFKFRKITSFEEEKKSVVFSLCIFVNRSHCLNQKPISQCCDHSEHDRWKIMFIHWFPKLQPRWEPIYGNLIFTINFGWAVKWCDDSCRAQVDLSNFICKNCISIFIFHQYNELIIICKLMDSFFVRQIIY